MTYQKDCTLPEDLLESIADNGLECLPDLFRILVNAARQQGAQSTKSIVKHSDVGAAFRRFIGATSHDGSVRLLVVVPLLDGERS